MLDVLSGSSASRRLGGCESVSKWTDATLLEHREGFGDFGGEVAAIDVPVDMRGLNDASGSRGQHGGHEGIAGVVRVDRRGTRR